MATVVTHPDKAQVRAWMQKRVEHPAPPPTPSEIRRQLGWSLGLNADPFNITR